MAKVSANYEVVFVIDPAQGEEGIAALVNNFKTLIEQNGSAVEVEEWGTRKLRINDGIMRSLIVCKGE